MMEPITDLDIKILLINIDNHPARDPGELFVADCIRRMIPELQRLWELEKACRHLGICVHQSRELPSSQLRRTNVELAIAAIGRLLEGPK